MRNKKKQTITLHTFRWWGYFVQQFFILFTSSNSSYTRSIVFNESIPTRTDVPSVVLLFYLQEFLRRTVFFLSFLFTRKRRMVDTMPIPIEII